MAIDRHLLWRHGALVSVLAVSLAGCAMPGQVQRIGVEYNTAVAGMANELTLLNIVRAKEDMPLHYTAVNRLTGTVTVKGSTNIGPIKDKAKTLTKTQQTTTPPVGGATVVDTATNTGVKGGNSIFPYFGGEISSGPSFDIGVLDTQKFYQGILAPIPFQIIENYISQGYDNQLLIRLLVEKIEVKLKDDVADVGKAGDVVLTLTNAAYGPEAETFAATLACYQLGGGTVKKPPVKLMPLSRVTRTPEGKVQPLTIEDLAKLDGKAFDLEAPSGGSLPVSADGKGDDEVIIKRLAEEKKVASLTYIAPRYPFPNERITAVCQPVYALTDTAHGHPALRPPESPKAPPADPYYLGDSKVLVFKPATQGGLPGSQIVGADLQITFRSPESVLRFLGRYLQAAEDHPGQVFDLGGRPLFTVKTDKAEHPVVETQLLRRTYAIDDDQDRRRNMMVIALIEQLVNLHKEATDRPASVPVYALQ